MVLRKRELQSQRSHRITSSWARQGESTPPEVEIDIHNAKPLSPQHTPGRKPCKPLSPKQP